MVPLLDLDLCYLFPVFFQRRDSLIYESSESSKNLYPGLAQMGEKAAVLFLRLFYHPAREAEGTTAGVVLPIGFTSLLLLGLGHCVLRIQSADGLPRVSPCLAPKRHRPGEGLCSF